MIFRIREKLNHILIPLFMLCYNIEIFSRLLLSIEAYNIVKSRCFLNIIII